jgi:hypothetical protein
MSGIFGDDEGTLGSQFVSEENSFVAQLGRISGKALQPNLVRNGADLTFRNGATDSDLLYLDVNNYRIGIKTDVPNYDLEIISDVKTTRLIADDTRIDNILISNSRFSTVVGPINIVPSGPDPKIIIERLITDNLDFNDNNISSFNNSNIVLDASGTGTVELQATTRIYADLDVSGNINLGGNLSKQGNIIIGDEITDVVIINTDFTQSIIPGDNNTYDLGKSNKKWNNLFTPDLTNIGTILPRTAVISNQLRLDGNNNEIFAVQSNEDVALMPDTGIVYIEQTKWQDNDITNLLNTPLTFASIGIGYTRFMGDNGIVVPAGTDLERSVSPEVGETRWNTDQGYLECFDGNIWIISIGPGDLISSQDMEEFGNIYSLVLG